MSSLQDNATNPRTLSISPEQLNEYFTQLGMPIPAGSTAVIGQQDLFLPEPGSTQVDAAQVDQALVDQALVEVALKDLIAETKRAYDVDIQALRASVHNVEERRRALERLQQGLIALLEQRISNLLSGTNSQGGHSEDPF